jgi:hypothetical protein
MVMLLDLPNELLLQIVAYHRTIHDLWLISLSCKRLNAFCSCWIFEKYVLRLRSRCEFRDFGPPRYLTPLDSIETLKSWDLDAVTARLHHLRDKAPYVKELILEEWRDLDNKNGDADEPDVFPECIMPALLDALKGAKQVTCITVTTSRYGGTLPLPLWEWITTKDLTTFRIGSLLAPPPNAKMHYKVQNFEGGLYNESMPFLEVSDTPGVNVFSSS